MVQCVHNVIFKKLKMINYWPSMTYILGMKNQFVKNYPKLQMFCLFIFVNLFPFKINVPMYEVHVPY